MRDGEDRFFSQRDNRSSNDVVYRLRVREAGSERLIIELENVTAVRFPWFFCSPPAIFARSISSNANGADD
jgi:hypothetical protein